MDRGHAAVKVALPYGLWQGIFHFGSHIRQMRRNEFAELGKSALRIYMTFIHHHHWCARPFHWTGTQSAGL